MEEFDISDKDIKVPVAPILQTFHILMIRSAKFWIPYKKQIRKQLLFLFLIMGICLGNAAYGLDEFFENSSRVPLMISSTVLEPKLVEEPVSTIDVCPTLCDCQVAIWTS